MDKFKVDPESLDLSSKPLYGIVFFAIPTAIFLWMLFDEFVMRRKPILGVILGIFSLIAVTSVILSKTLQEFINVDEFTTFMIIKSYLLCVPATLCPLFRIIHGSEERFNRFKKYICCNSPFMKHKMGHQHIIAIVMYLFLVCNIAEAVIFEFLAPWKDMRDEYERVHNPMTGFGKWTTLFNAITGFLVILMIPFPTKSNWFLFSETEQNQESPELSEIIITNSTESSEDGKMINVKCDCLLKEDLEKKSSAKYNDLLMVLQTNQSTLAKVFAYAWILTYSSWNWLFTVRYLGAGSVIDGCVHIFAPIFRSIIYHRSDLWLSSRLHVLWWTLICWIPIAKVTKISKRTEELNQNGLTAWAIINLVVAIGCFSLFVWLKRLSCKYVLKRQPGSRSLLIDISERVYTPKEKSVSSIKALNTV